MIARFFRPILTAVTLLLVCGAGLNAQDPAGAKTKPKEKAASPANSPRPLPKRTEPLISGTPMLGEPTTVAPVAKHGKAAPAAQKKSSKTPYSQRVNLNTASKEELKKLPGVSDEIAAKIIAGRPYKSKAGLVGNDRVPAALYFSIKDKVTAVQKPAKR